MCVYYIVIMNIVVHATPDPSSISTSLVVVLWFIDSEESILDQFSAETHCGLLIKVFTW